MRNILRKGVIAICFLTPHFCWGLSSDKHLPATFMAREAMFNQKTGIDLLNGNVTITQGTTHLTGDHVVLSNDTATQKTRKITASGKLAHYQTLPDNQTRLLDAWAEVIDYLPAENTVILTGHALVTQGTNRFEGPRIIYNMAKQTVLTAPTSHETRSVIVLEPKDLPGKRAS